MYYTKTEIKAKVILKILMSCRKKLLHILAFGLCFYGLISLARRQKIKQSINLHGHSPSQCRGFFSCIRPHRCHDGCRVRPQ